MRKKLDRFIAIFSKKHDAVTVIDIYKFINGYNNLQKKKDIDDMERAKLAFSYATKAFSSKNESLKNIVDYITKTEIEEPSQYYEGTKLIAVKDNQTYSFLVFDSSTKSSLSAANFIVHITEKDGEMVIVPEFKFFENIKSAEFDNKLYNNKQLNKKTIQKIKISKNKDDENQL